MESLIILLIVVGAAVYVGRTFYRGVKRKDPCGSGCACCGSVDSCSQPADRDARDAGSTPADRHPHH
jgi:hypothetical protein